MTETQPQQHALTPSRPHAGTHHSISQTHLMRRGRQAAERKTIVNYLSGTGTGLVTGGASLAATGTSSTASLIIAASVALVLGGLTTYAAAVHRRRRDADAAGH